MLIIAVDELVSTSNKEFAASNGVTGASLTSVLPMKFDVVLKSTTGKEETIKGVSNGDVIKLPDGERIDMHTQIAVENYY